jgi:eukaryotic-like serine/threonine-protein kinase
MGTDYDYYELSASPEHTITLSEYTIDKYEVTNAQYARCVASGACAIPSNTSSYNDPSHSNFPVTYVSWYDANNYCSWTGMRLPTEAEWEKAARGEMVSETELYSWGTQSPDCSIANYYGTNSNYTCVDRPARVGRYTYGASPYGAMDIAGNVAEWVSDWYDYSYYQNSPTENPTGPDTGPYKVLRGGSWSDIYIEVFARENQLPTVKDGYTGFRCAASASP